MTTLRTYHSLDTIKEVDASMQKKQKQGHANPKIKAGIETCTLSSHICAEGRS